MKKIFSTIIFSAVFLCAFLVMGISAQAEELPRYGVTTISDPDVKYAYDVFVRELTKETLVEKIDFDRDGLKAEDVKKAFKLFLGDYPECFWIQSGYDYSYYSVSKDVFSMTPKYYFAQDELKKAISDMEKVITQIMKGLPSTSNYDKALYLHDRLAEWTTYRMVGCHQTAYGALVDRQAVCSGYVAAYQILLQRCGIMSYPINGKNSKTLEDHSWNLVWIEKGVCVYTDVTWDDIGDNTYHYYFNVSRADIAKEHIFEETTISVPSCNHEGQSYFDKNDFNVHENMSISKLASMFSDAEDGRCYATVCYSGSNVEGFKSWLKDNSGELYAALGGTETYEFSLLQNGNEIKIAVSGKFSYADYHNYTVQIIFPVGFDPRTSLYESVSIGKAITPYTCKAESGYYFPEYYELTKCGVTVERLSSKEIHIYGIPTDNVSLFLPTPLLMQKEDTPKSVFETTGENSGTLFQVGKGYKYSFDGVNWNNAPAAGYVCFKNIPSNIIYVVKCGDGETTFDSDMQIISIPAYIAPTTEGSTTVTVTSSSETVTRPKDEPIPEGTTATVKQEEEPIPDGEPNDGDGEPILTDPPDRGIGSYLKIIIFVCVLALALIIIVKIKNPDNR